MYTKQLREDEVVLVLDDPITVNNGDDTIEISEFSLNELNNFEEEIYHTINYVKLMESSGVSLNSNIKTKPVKVKISYDSESDKIKLLISYDLASDKEVRVEYELNEEEFISNVIDEMILENNKYIYGISIVRDMIEKAKEDIFYTYINDKAFVVNQEVVNSTVSCISREDGKCIAIANRFMYIPSHDTIVLCELIESSNLLDHDYINLEMIFNGYKVIIERVSLAARSRGKVKYACLVLTNSTVLIERTDDEPVVFDDTNLLLPTLNDYLNTNSSEGLANVLYENNNQNKINQFYKNNNLINIALININNYLL